VILVKKVAVLFPVASKTIPPEAFAYFPVPMPVVVVDGIQPLTSLIYRFWRTIFFTSPVLGIHIYSSSRRRVITRICNIQVLYHDIGSTIQKNSIELVSSPQLGFWCQFIAVGSDDDRGPICTALGENRRPNKIGASF
jgi:hypothetical protein